MTGQTPPKPPRSPAGEADTRGEAADASTNRADAAVLGGRYGGQGGGESGGAATGTAEGTAGGATGNPTGAYQFIGEQAQALAEKAQEPGPVDEHADAKAEAGAEIPAKE
jgi:hypothetical protein